MHLWSLELLGAKQLQRRNQEDSRMTNKTGNSVSGKSNLQIQTIIYNSMDLYSIILVLINYMLEILIRRGIQVQVKSAAKKPDQMLISSAGIFFWQFTLHLISYLDFLKQ